MSTNGIGYGIPDSGYPGPPEPPTIPECEQCEGELDDNGNCHTCLIQDNITECIRWGLGVSVPLAERTAADIIDLLYAEGVLG